jgi:ABC-type nitrate/sulfonate/bicarbonate transport system permease component
MATTTAAVATRRPRRHSRWSALEPTLLPLGTFIVLIAAWEVAARSGLISPLFFSSPTAILEAGADNLTKPSFWNDVWVSCQEFIVGYVLAAVIAIPFGLVTGWFTTPHYLVEPWLAGFNATPRLALLPLVILWVGLGFWSKAVIVFLGSFFPIAINTFHGVRTVDKGLLDVSTSFGASGPRRLWTVVLPSVVPFTLVGMRLGIGRAISGVVVAEFFTSQAGLGHFIFRAGSRLETADLLFGALFITLLALFAFRGLGFLEKRFQAWQPRVGS